MSQEDRKIVVLNAVLDLDQDDAPRGVLKSIQGVATKASEISIGTLNQNATIFFNDISGMFEAIETSFHGFELEQVELIASITSTGRLALVVGEYEAGFQGSIKLVFGRKKR